MKVGMFVKNDFVYDARVHKQSATLVRAGHQVTVIALCGRDLARTEWTKSGYQIIRVFPLRLPTEKLQQWRQHIQNTAVGTRVGEGGTTPKTRNSTLGSIGKYLMGVINSWGLELFEMMIEAARSVKSWATDRAMLAAVRLHDFDAVHCHDANTLPVGVRYKQLHPHTLLVYDSHELATERNGMNRHWRRAETRRERSGLSQAQGLILASPLWEKYLSDKYQTIPDLVETILNVPVTAEPQTSNLKQRAGLNPEQPVLVYQGTIQPNRGIEAAIGAISDLTDRGVALVIIGFGYFQTQLERLVASLDLSDRVRFVGAVPTEELIGLTTGADIGMCNIVNSSLSYYTTLPNKLFEYFAAGLAVIGSDSPGIGAVIDQTGAGLTVTPDSPTAISDAVRQILDDPQPYRQSALQASRQYCWENEERKLIEFYRNLAELNAFESQLPGRLN